MFVKYPALGPHVCDKGLPVPLPSQQCRTMFGLRLTMLRRSGYDPVLKTLTLAD